MQVSAGPSSGWYQMISSTYMILTVHHTGPTRSMGWYTNLYTPFPTLAAWRRAYSPLLVLPSSGSSPDLVNNQHIHVVIWRVKNQDFLNIFSYFVVDNNGHYKTKHAKFIKNVLYFKCYMFGTFQQNIPYRAPAALQRASRGHPPHGGQLTLSHWVAQR